MFQILIPNKIENSNTSCLCTQTLCSKVNSIIYTTSTTYDGNSTSTTTTTSQLQIF